MKKGMKNTWFGIVFPVLAAGVLFFFLTAFSNLEKKSSEEGKQQLEQALQRCVITCYATEGIYPPSVEYMKEHYGIQVDEERYLVIYEIAAENLRPEITVLERNHEE